MARKPLDIGTRGRITTKELEPGKHKAWCRFRDLDGHTRLIERTGPTARKAEANLERALRDRVAPPPPKPGDTNTTAAVPTHLTTASRVKHAGAIWMKRIETKRVGTTYDTYRRWYTSRVLPEFGELLITEMSVPRLQNWFDRLAIEPSATTGRPLSANSRRAIRKVISGILQVAVRYGILTLNPVDQMDEIEEEGRRRKRAVAYDAERALVFFAAIDLDRVAARTQLNLIIKTCFFTGARIGEVIGLRWRDLNLTDKPVHVSDPVAGDQIIPPRSVWFNGNIVRVTGKGIRRHDGKTSGSVGVVELAPAMVSMLEMIRPPNARPGDPVFPSGAGGWRDPNTLQTSIRRLRTRVDFPDFTSHIGRKTHGTALDAAGLTAREIADQLRKASVRDVQETYMGRGLVNKAAAGMVDAFFRPDGQ